jgi:hypothetical protein
MYLISTAITTNKIIAAIVVLIVLIGVIAFYVTRRSSGPSGPA